MPLLILEFAMAGLSVFGQVMQGRAAKKAAQSQAAAAEMTAKQQEFNAGVADKQAADSLTRGEDATARLQEQVRGLIGTQRSGYAGQGVVVDSGSAADVQADARGLGEADVRTIRANAQREAWGFRVDAENSRRNAAIARQGGVIALKEGAAAQRAAYIGAATTVVGTAGTMVAQRYGWKQSTSTSTSRASQVGPQLSRADAAYLRGKGTPPFVNAA